LWIWLDLGFFIGFSQPSSTPEEIHRGSGMTAFFHEDPDLYRVMMLEDSTTSFSKMFLRPARNVTYGIAMPQGYEQLYPKRYVRFYSIFTKRSRDAGYILHPTHEYEPELADFLNCKYVVTSAGNSLLEDHTGYRKMGEGKDFRIYLNESAMPRAFLVHESRVLDGPDAVEALIRAHPESLKKSVIFERSSGEAPLVSIRRLGKKDRVTVGRYEPNRVEIAADASADGYLVLSDNYFPGWHAFLDGRETPVVLADYSFRAVRVPEGEHRVVFVYDPPSARAGLLVSLAVLAVLFIVLRSRRMLNFSSYD
jgi:hypothetical protein